MLVVDSKCISGAKQLCGILHADVHHLHHRLLNLLITCKRPFSLSSERI